MCAKTGSIGASVARVGSAFIQHFQRSGFEPRCQCLLHLLGERVHGDGSFFQAAVSSLSLLLMCGAT